MKVAKKQFNRYKKRHRKGGSSVIAIPTCYQNCAIKILMEYMRSEALGNFHKAPPPIFYHTIAPTYSSLLYDTDLDGAEQMVLAPGHEAAGLLEHALETQKYISK